jgi:hypothetical protein
MWQDTTRKVLTKIRPNGRFRAMHGLSWIVLIVVLALVVGLVALFLATRRS